MTRDQRRARRQGERNVHPDRPGPVATAEALEGRQLLSVAVALAGRNSLITFDTSNPGVQLATTRVRGLERGDNLLGVDFRPATGELYGLGSTRLYRIDPAAGAATAVGGPFAVELDGDEFGFDFNPSVDRIRVVSDGGQNLRLNPDDGTVVDADPVAAGVQADANLAYATGDPGAGATPAVVAAAYSNNLAGGTPTTLYVIDRGRDALLTKGSPDGAPTSPNTGQLFSVGSLGIDPVTFGGLDILTDPAGTGNQVAFAAFTTGRGQASTLYSVNLQTGATTAGAPIGRRRAPVTDIAVAPVGANVLLVTSRNELMRINSTTPHLVLARARVTGISRRERIVGMDTRPAKNVLYVMTDAARLYVVNLTTLVATPAAESIGVELDGRRVQFGFDFNPSVDRVRVVSEADQNLRLHPETGLAVDADPDAAGVQLDTNLAYAPGDPNAAANPRIVAAAYTNNVAAGTPTTLYAIDADLNTLVTQGSPTGAPTSPNTGQLFTVGALGVDVNETAGLDIRTTTPAAGGAATDTALAVFTTADRQTGLYSIDLTTGTARRLGGFARTARGVVDLTAMPG